ncbi:tRNA uridine-5-carboxymethylaminomethyl(34) synthesis GTPase MnmE [Gilvibacter sp.]|uniref:tRNA uridine-5-carboxymethylaminomethyl(34) synthesis GTPase MnmE n=1 Tax=Gilvibacter sp. TaxID=2729997 RepID=UPI0025BC68FE|nr:tRNA uridine-5-carboxymethylaminomethyl(34) synthesis GTPase MnmE [Gilvibacter sp.]NQX77665.1 tRNA uridine-5-carboxymethylaminomethyl(34) synthesis GTPase MnmE [Gilvibacter sp.]
MIQQETIVALATPPGTGAIAVIRLSGQEAFDIADQLFISIHNKQLKAQKTHTAHLGHIVADGQTVDEVLAILYKGPTSYTGEDVVEFSCHGSPYIQQRIINLALASGCRAAKPGEFTLRAFINGKMDLSQAEAVADLIASDSEAAHQVAMQQMRGGFSEEIKTLRQELLNFASLIELELDFSEEDVEFADRSAFEALLERLQAVLKRLVDSFAIGNVIKHGIPVAIVGAPNVGKSTLLNALLNEERAIVSDIAGTTRDTVEDEISVGGLNFRFIDTAGIRNTEDTVERIGIEKTFEKINQAQVIIYLLEAQEVLAQPQELIQQLRSLKEKHPQKPVLVVANKLDLLESSQQSEANELLEQAVTDLPQTQKVLMSAKAKEGVEALQEGLLEFVNTGALKNDQSIVTNSRHYDALLKALEEITKVREGMQAQLSGDLLAIDIRQALYHLGEITGEITNDELLGNIFANFCIGK